MTQKGSHAMGRKPCPDERTPRIVPLVAAQEQAAAAALARYWDARQGGQLADPADLDPEMLDMVYLLEHYRGVTGSLNPAQPPTATPPWRPVHLTALVVLAAAILLFSSNTLLSPRSWLLSSAPDPDWIPWVSDDWLGGSVPHTGNTISQEAPRVTTMEDFAHGA